MQTATHVHYRTIDQMRQAGDLDGFHLVPTYGLLDSIDEESCDTRQCPNCGTVGMLYWPYLNRQTREYKPIAECIKCSYAECF